MDSSSLWTAFALVLVIEGLLPLISPGGWRRTFERLLDMHDGQIRFFGMASVLTGLLMIWLLA